MYYTAATPKRSLQANDATSPSRSAHSPLRNTNLSTILMDPYSRQQQYSPTISTTNSPLNSPPLRLLLHPLSITTWFPPISAFSPPGLTSRIPERRAKEDEGDLRKTRIGREGET
jgi:hypothetical protein